MRQVPEAKIVPMVKIMPPIEKIKIDKFVPSKKQQLQGQQRLNQSNLHTQKIIDDVVQQDKENKVVVEPETCVDEPEKTKLDELDVKEEKDDAKVDSEQRLSVKAIAVDEKDMIDKCEGKNEYK